jgi:magnesium transporter
MRDPDETPQQRLTNEPPRSGPLRAALLAGDRAAAVAAAGAMHPADLADLLEQLDHDQRATLTALLGPDLPPKTLGELEDDVRDDVLDVLSPEDLAAAVRRLDSDELVYLVEDLDPAERGRVLDALDPARRAAVERSLAWPEDSAGRMMRQEFVTAPAHWSVGEAIDFMRGRSDLPQDFHHIVLVDPAMRPKAMVPLSRVMATPRDRPLAELAEPDMHPMAARDPQEDVAYAFNQYHMASAPVLDRGGRLIGVIHIEDAMEALEEEAEEDLRMLAGVGDESLTDRIGEIVRARAPWLSVSLVAAMLSATVISGFEETIAQLTALAVLMPVITAMGGNAGTQSLTVTVRALAARDLTAANALRVVGRELLVGLSNGMIFSVVVALVSWLWFRDPALSGTIAAAMTITLTVAALAGVLVPLSLDRMGKDPAIASGPFVTTMIDVVGFFVFLGLATLLLV